MNIVLERIGNKYVGQACLPPKREVKTYELAEIKGGELVLSRIGRRQDTVVGVFQPTDNRFSRGNVSGLKASLKFEKFDVNIHIEDSNAETKR